MADKVKYSIVDSESGNISVQSTVKSFNLDHVTEKDIVSFYNYFSQYAAWDTGLLPVDGSGMLSIRTAGVYTQFAYQHKPGLYHINWSVSEGSPATPYYLAQPWRIIICDMKDGNLLGARMFYSPYPITSPTQPLYHVNLPNTNCKGYRKNGVGWQCLYQNEDWSTLPLNERIVRFIERCSGVETFNDGNMSETDGPRFYRDHNKPEYLWDPVEWQYKSEKQGYEWTLDESLWIPVLVTDKDKQSQHDSTGNPLTFADALVGDYRAHYYDDQETKPINAIIRPDKELPASTVMQYFVAAYASATSKTTHILNNTFESSQIVKDKKGSAQFKGSSLLFAPQNHNLADSDGDNEDEDDDEDSFYCESCNEVKHVDSYALDAYGNAVCLECINEHYINIPSVNKYFNLSDEHIVYSQYQGEYFHDEYDTVVCCDCSEVFGAQGTNKEVPYLHSTGDGAYYCPCCLQEFAKEEQYQVASCYACATPFITEYASANNFIKTFIAIPNYLFNDDGTQVESITNKEVYFCSSCSNNHYICPCGYVKNKSLNDLMNHNVDHSVKLNNSILNITSCCADCTQLNFDTSEVSIDFKPSNPNYVDYHILLESLKSVSPLHMNYNEPF